GLSGPLQPRAVTVWDSAPAALQQVTAVAPVAARSALRLVLLSGDWIPVTLPGRVRALWGEAVTVVGMGGATEAAIWSNWYDIAQVDATWASIPYGRSIPNATYYVLDAQLRLAPAGVPGALYIGGVCLALGYWRRATVTAGRFVADPYGQPGARTYRTGDLAPW